VRPRRIRRFSFRQSLEHVLPPASRQDDLAVLGAVEHDRRLLALQLLAIAAGDNRRNEADRDAAGIVVEDDETAECNLAIVIDKSMLRSELRPGLYLCGSHRSHRFSLPRS